MGTIPADGFTYLVEILKVLISTTLIGWVITREELGYYSYPRLAVKLGRCRYSNVQIHRLKGTLVNPCS